MRGTPIYNAANRRHYVITAATDDFDYYLRRAAIETGGTMNSREQYRLPKMNDDNFKCSPRYHRRRRV